MSLPASAGRSLKTRSIYIKVKPAPLSLSERLSVLRALKQHGKIEVFKRLYDPSSFISITGSSAVAQAICRRSPLQFDYAHKPIGEDKSDGADANKTFTLEVFPAPQYNHKRIIKESPLHGAWPSTQDPLNRTSFMTATLSAMVPKDMAFDGLRNWETGAPTEATQPAPPTLTRDHIRLRRAAAQKRRETPGLMDAVAAADKSD